VALQTTLQAMQGALNMTAAVVLGLKVLLFRGEQVGAQIRCVPSLISKICSFCSEYGALLAQPIILSHW
jgi:hypothetical protein